MSFGRRAGFVDRYGPWALVAGASEGLGAEFARGLARRGLDLILVARRRDALAELCDELTEAQGVRAEPLVLDLASDDLVEAVEDGVGGREVGLLVYNAGLSIIGPFMEQPLEALLETIAVNCRGPLSLAHLLGRHMLARRRGGVVLMSSLSALQGTPLVATYAATKAFDLVLAEGLWEELRAGGVDVIACAAGVISTPNYIASRPARAGLTTPAPLTPEQVAAETLEALELGRGPVVVPGTAYRFSSFLMQRLLPRKLAIKIIGANLRAMYPRSS